MGLNENTKQERIFQMVIIQKYQFKEFLFLTVAAQNYLDFEAICK